MPGFAMLATVAWQSRLNGNAVAFMKRRYPCCFRDNAGAFVAEDLGIGANLVSDPSVPIVMGIGRANTYGFHGHPNLSLTDFRRGSFDNFKVIDAEEVRGFHGRINRALRCFFRP
jgi:hypothetical protein